MKTFPCTCGNTLHFENTECLACGRAVGFLPRPTVMSALEPVGDSTWQALADGMRYRMCKNYVEFNVCNWMVPADSEEAYCESCRLNHIIPDLSDPKHLTLWSRIETAKRRLLYTLFGLGLPVVGRDQDPQGGLAFEFLADPAAPDEFSNQLAPRHQVLTGHATGLITINIREADPGAREEMRERMNEGYRTLLGHFRHESGHYYWERLVAGTAWEAPFRTLFGDERSDYDSALQSYYAAGPPPGWRFTHISAYASAHPWEDWAETWAHYLHMVDTLETARDFRYRVDDPAVASTPNGTGRTQDDHAAGFDDLLADWGSLTVALNALNRSMGQADAYPFAAGERATAKLRLVHDVVQSVRTNP